MKSHKEFHEAVRAVANGKRFYTSIEVGETASGEQWALFSASVDNQLEQGVTAGEVLALFRDERQEHVDLAELGDAPVASGKRRK